MKATNSISIPGDMAVVMADILSAINEKRSTIVAPVNKTLWCLINDSNDIRLISPSSPFMPNPVMAADRTDVSVLLTDGTSELVLKERRFTYKESGVTSEPFRFMSVDTDKGMYVLRNETDYDSEPVTTVNFHIPNNDLEVKTERYAMEVNRHIGMAMCMIVKSMLDGVRDFELLVHRSVTLDVETDENENSRLWTVSREPYFGVYDKVCFSFKPIKAYPDIQTIIPDELAVSCEEESISCSHTMFEYTKKYTSSGEEQIGRYASLKWDPAARRAILYSGPDKTGIDGISVKLNNRYK